MTFVPFSATRVLIQPGSFTAGVEEIATCAGSLDFPGVLKPGAIFSTETLQKLSNAEMAEIVADDEPDVPGKATLEHV